MHSGKSGRIIDGVALAVGVSVDIGFNAVCFWIQAPDLLTHIAMALLGSVIVLFSVRAYLGGNRPLWLVLAFVATFYDVSLALETTRTQTVQAGIIDPIKTRLEQRLNDAEKVLAEKNEKYLGTRTGYRSELTVIESGIANAQKRADESLNDLMAYKPKAREENKLEITADGIYNAIPHAVNTGRWIPLGILLLVFGGLQGTIAMSAKTIQNAPNEELKAQKIKKSRNEIPKEVVQQWVRLGWYRYTPGNSPVLPSEQEMATVFERRGMPYKEGWEKLILKKAIDLGLVDSNRKILRSEETAKLKMNEAIKI